MLKSKSQLPTQLSFSSGGVETKSGKWYLLLAHFFCSLTNEWYILHGRMDTCNDPAKKSSDRPPTKTGDELITRKLSHFSSYRLLSVQSQAIHSSQSINFQLVCKPWSHTFCSYHQTQPATHYSNYKQWGLPGPKHYSSGHLFSKSCFAIYPQSTKKPS